MLSTRACMAFTVTGEHTHMPNPGFFLHALPLQISSASFSAEREESERTFDTRFGFALVTH